MLLGTQGWQSGLLVLGVGDLVLPLGMRSAHGTMRPIPGPWRVVEEVLESAVVGSLRELRYQLGVV